MYDVHIYANTNKMISLVVNIWAGMGITDHINVAFYALVFYLRIDSCP